MEVAHRQLARWAVVVLMVLSCALSVFGDSSWQLPQEQDDSAAQRELQVGTQLTRQGHFAEAIPHLLASRGGVRDEYAASFNLALCYVGTVQYKQAIEILRDLHSHNKPTAEVESLLAQALIGDGKKEEAFSAAQRAARIAPKNEKLYLLVTDACVESGDYDLGLKIAELGLHELPGSPRLLFEHGMLLAQFDSNDAAKRDLERVTAIAPGTDIAFIAAAQKSLFDGDIKQAIRSAREGIQRGNQHFMLLTLYGEAVMRAGIGPGQPEFVAAQQALEKAVAGHPNYSSAQIALAKILLMQGRMDDAISHLEIARQLDPKNPAVYANLAAAYRQRGDEQRVLETLDALAKLNREQVEKISTAPGETKRGYAAAAPR